MHSGDVPPSGGSAGGYAQHPGPDRSRPVPSPDILSLRRASQPIYPTGGDPYYRLVDMRRASLQETSLRMLAQASEKSKDPGTRVFHDPRHLGTGTHGPRAGHSLPDGVTLPRLPPLAELSWDTSKRYPVQPPPLEPRAALDGPVVSLAGLSDKPVAKGFVDERKSSVDSQEVSYHFALPPPTVPQASPTHAPPTPTSVHGLVFPSTPHHSKPSSAPAVGSETQKEGDNKPFGESRHSPNIDGSYAKDRSSHSDDARSTGAKHAHSHSPTQQFPGSTRMNGYSMSESSVERPFRCPYPDCTRSFVRSSDQRRHIRSHEKPLLQCPYWDIGPSCHRNGGSFNRLDVLKRHLKLVHYSHSKNNPSGWCKVCYQNFNSVKDFIGHCNSCSAAAREQLQLENKDI